MKKIIFNPSTAEVLSSTTPTVGFRKIYPKADGWYDLDSSGNETKLLTSNIDFGDLDFLPLTGGTITGDLYLNGNLGLRASSTSSSPTQIPVFTSDPTSTTQTVATRTPSQLRSDIGAAATVHTHSVSDIINLQTFLDGKSDVGHTHIITDITGLQNALDGKGTVSLISTNNGITGGDITTTGTIGLTGQALALHNLSTNGLVARTGAGTFAARTLTGTANQVTVTNGDGVSGNPTLSLPQNIHTAATPTFGGATLNGNLGIRAAATASAASQIPVFISDPTSTTQTVVTRTPAQLRTDIDAAATTHTHAISDVTNLQTTLDGKQNILGFTPENVTNKSTDTTLASNSDILYPSQRAVKSYVDNSVSSVSIADATTTVKGKIKLAGDLSGTADLPTVPGLATKINSSEKGAVNGVATLDNTGVVPANQSRGSSLTLNSSNYVITLTDARGETTQIDLPIESLFQNANYNSSAQTLTLTTISGGTVSISLADLVDLPEVVISTNSNPGTIPSTGQKLFFRTDNGNYWISNDTSWVGPFLNITSNERAKLAGIQEGATANSTDAQLRDRSTHTGTQAISTVTNLQTTLDNKSNIGHTHVINDVTGLQTALDEKQPTGNYSVVGHTHTISDVTNLQTTLDGKAATVHTHTKSQITDFAHTHTIADLPVATNGTSSSTQVVRADDSRLSDSRTPVAHTHAISEVTNLQTELNLKAPLASPDLTGTPTAPTATSGTNTTQVATTAFVQTGLATKANTTHTHAISDVTNLQTTLDDKQATLVSGTNIKTINGTSILGSGNLTVDVTTWGQITGDISNQTDLQTILNNKSNVGHTHSIGDVINLQTTLDNKSNVGHTHTKSEITDFAHTHTIGEIINLQTELNQKENTLGFTPENIINKSTDTTLSSNSDVLYPSEKAVKTYIDASVASVSIADATDTIKGKIRLAGDLSGTADLPTVPGLANKINLSEKGAVNGVATLDNTGVIPASQNRGSSLTLDPNSFVVSLTDARGETTQIDLPIESLFETANYNSSNQTLTLTTISGSVLNIPLSDLVDLPEIVISGNSNPGVSPSTGEKVYFRVDNGNYWISNGSSWVGPFFNITSTERTKLAGIQDGATANSTDAQLRDRATHTGTQAISTVTNLQTTLDGKSNIGHTHVISDVTNLQTSLDTKVDKITGKGLSTEDYTTTEKTKLAGIESGAQVNTVNSVNTKTGVVVLDKSDISLGNVDNTSDLNKPISTQTQSALDGKSNIGHTHIINDVTGLQTALDGKQPIGNYSLVGHTHTIADLPVASDGTVSSSQIVRADDSRLSDSRIPLVHTHNISEVNNLQSELNLKAPLASPALTGTPTAPTATSNTNTTQIATTAFVQTGLATKSNTGHTHTISDVTNLQTILDGKANTIHNHTISDVTNLQTSLDSKQATLISGTNIKTINGASVLGSGNLTIGGGDGNVANTNKASGTNFSLTTTEQGLLELSIFPSNVNARILVIARMDAQKDGGTTVRNATMRIRRGTTNGDVQIGNDSIINSINVAAAPFGPAVVQTYDEPNTTDTVTYTLRALSSAALTATRFEITVIEINAKGDKGEKGEDGSGAIWGNIGGTLSNQTDLQNALNSKGTVSLISTNNGITGGDITTTGTIGLTGRALALHNLSSAGFMVMTGGGPLTRAITGTANQVTVTNGDGTGSNPTLSLPQDIHTAATPTFGGATLNGTLGVRASSTASSPTQIPVFISDPTSTTQTVVTRTPAQLRTDIGAAATTHTHAISDVTNLQTTLDGKQATLVSGTNIKTVNGTSILGSGDLVVGGSSQWGQITGTLSNQTDLQNALNSKGTVSLISTNNGITGGDITTTGTIGLTGQALALHNLSTNGLVARTGAGTVAARTITGTANQVTVSNGDGVSGNPTLSLPQNIHTAATPTFGGATLNGTLGVRASATGSVATHIPVFTANPTSTTQTVVTRTPVEFRSDIGAAATTHTHNISDVTNLQTELNNADLYLSYSSAATFEFFAPFNMRITSIDKSNAATITVRVNGSLYTFNNTITKFDVITVESSGSSSVIVKGEKI
jgi:hypothetical protein